MLLKAGDKIRNEADMENPLKKNSKIKDMREKQKIGCADTQFSSVSQGAIFYASGGVLS
ncbi:hypothetical protein [uncultured Desulfuromonas sp.]|uniref:hypothetical protein n=1 Tax=uncultured Desulfuromonas sp. TaxID=181013 RepID=UPI002AAAFED0|nr:hypothetical protein [uncultured Desulfuromonas sp.]